LANTDNPHGFAFHSSPGPYPPRTRTYIKLVGTGTAIFINDVCHFKAGTSASEDGAVVEPFGTGTPGTTIPGGVALNYGAVSTKTRHSVIVDDNAEYEAQDDGDSITGLPTTAAGQNANVIATAGDAAVDLYSNHQIDGSSAAVTGSLDLYLIRKLPIADNAFGSDFVRFICRFNKLSEQQTGITRV
jgi:hypothetical protein